MTNTDAAGGSKQATLYLVAHKAHGVACFDVAEQLACPECAPHGNDLIGCDECDGLGYWWIGATSGWRMYPWWWHKMDASLFAINAMDFLIMMPPHARELHNASARDKEPAKPSSLLAALGLKPKVEPIKRRI